MPKVCKLLWGHLIRDLRSTCVKASMKVPDVLVLDGIGKLLNY
jgi:hypothetical protein